MTKFLNGPNGYAVYNQTVVTTSAGGTPLTAYLKLLFQKTREGMRNAWPRYLSELFVTGGVTAAATYIVTNDVASSEVTLYVACIVIAAVAAFETVYSYVLSGRDLFDDERSKVVAAEERQLSVANEIAALKRPRPRVLMDVGPDIKTKPFRLKAAPDCPTALNVGIVGAHLGQFYLAFKEAPATLSPGEMIDVTVMPFGPSSLRAEQRQFGDVIRHAVAFHEVCKATGSSAKTGFDAVSDFGDGYMAEFRLILTYEDYERRMFVDLYSVEVYCDDDGTDVRVRFVGSGSGDEVVAADQVADA